MSFDVPPVSRPEPVQAPAAPEPVGKAVPALPTGASVSVDTIPSAPPEELFQEMQAASARVDELRDQGRELHFSYDETEGRVQIQVRDLDGHVIRTIPPSKMLDVMSGEQLDV
jgi:flagellar protein FlaG